MDKDEEIFQSELKKSTFRRLLRSFLCILSGILIIASLSLYFLTPLSKSQNVKLKGSTFLSVDNINTLIDNDGDDNLLFYDNSKARELLEGYPLIESAKVQANPFFLSVEIREIYALCSYNDEIYFTDGESASDKTMNDGIYSSVVDKQKDNLMAFYPGELSTSDYKTFFAPLKYKVQSIKTLITDFAPIDNSLYAYRFFVPSTSYDFDYSFEYYVDGIETGLDVTKLSLCIDSLEINFKSGRYDTSDYLVDLNLGESVKPSIRVRFSYQNQAFQLVEKE